MSGRTENSSSLEGHDAEGRRPRNVVLGRLGEPVADEEVTLDIDNQILSSPHNTNPQLR